MSLEGICIYNFSPKGFAEDLRALIGEVLKALVDKVNRIFSACISETEVVIPAEVKKPPKITDQEYLHSKPTDILSKWSPDVIRGKLERQMTDSNNQTRFQLEDMPFRYYESGMQWNSYKDTYGFSAETIKEVGESDVGVCHARGHRNKMEDEHLADKFELTIGTTTHHVQLFGIFDGHGPKQTDEGRIASEFNKKNLQGELAKALREFNPNGLTEEGIWHALKKTFVQLREDFKNEHPDFKAGTTSTVAMILDDDQLWTANVGDSRTILDNGGKVLQLTEDAKPNDPKYKKNIENRGGTVEEDKEVWRVNGDLAVARASDHHLGNAINPRPKITVMPLSEIEPGSHLILYCDGVGDVSHPRHIVNAVHKANQNVDKKPTAELLAKNIVYSAFKAGSQDNLSAMVIPIKPKAKFAV